MTRIAVQRNRLARFAFVLSNTLFVLLLVGAAIAVSVAVLQGPIALAAAIPIAASLTLNGWLVLLGAFLQPAFLQWMAEMHQSTSETTSELHRFAELLARGRRGGTP